MSHTQKSAMFNNETNATRLTKRRKATLHFVVAAFALAAMILSGLFLGAERIPPAQVIAALFHRQNAQPFELVIVRDIRLPRVLLAGLCGALLAGSGTVFQGFFRNPLADSGIMGISSGATLGAVLSALVPAGTIALSTFLGTNLAALCAFFGAMLAALTVYAASRFHGQQGSTIMILLAGTAISTFFSALTSFILLVKDKELHRMFVWTLGSFSGKGWNEILLVLPVSLVSATMLFLCAPLLDVLSGGEQTARALGLNISMTRKLVLAAGALSAAAAVCIGGTIGFVGLIAPHIVRRIYGPRHIQLLSLSMIYGAAFLILADSVSRTVASPAELPVGIVTALIGAPLFVSLLFTSRSAFHE